MRTLDARRVATSDGVSGQAEPGDVIYAWQHWELHWGWVFCSFTANGDTYRRLTANEVDALSQRRAVERDAKKHKWTRVRLARFVLAETLEEGP